MNWENATSPMVLRDAVARIKARLERAYWECRSDDCDDLHDNLTSVEWRLRAAERRHG